MLLDTDLLLNLTLEASIWNGNRLPEDHFLRS